MARKRTKLTEVEEFFVDGHALKLKPEEIATKLGVAVAAVEKRIEEHPPAKPKKTIGDFAVHENGMSVAMTAKQSEKGDDHTKSFSPPKKPKYSDCIWRPDGD